MSITVLMNSDIMEGMESQELYYQLFDALQTATLHEIKLAQFLHETKHVKKDRALLEKIEHVTTVTLPDCMGRLIGALDLHNSFLSLGRYIRSFADAEFAVVKLQVLIMEQLKKNEIREPYPIIDRLVLCCDDLLETMSALMQAHDNN